MDVMKFFSTLAAVASCASATAADLGAIPFLDMEGGRHTLREYAGKVVLVVNVASRCGLTPQYKSLEELYRKHRDRGLVVLGFPCNDFAGQEPGTPDEIRTFCKTKYDVTFPLMAKISVKDAAQHPLYAALTGPQGAFPGDVKWNFGKFLIGRDGRPVSRFEPRTTPEAPELVAAVEKALDEKAPEAKPPEAK